MRGFQIYMPSSKTLWARVRVLRYSWWEKVSISEHLPWRDSHCVAIFRDCDFYVESDCGIVLLPASVLASYVGTCLVTLRVLLQTGQIWAAERASAFSSNATFPGHACVSLTHVPRRYTLIRILGPGEEGDLHAKETHPFPFHSRLPGSIGSKCEIVSYGIHGLPSFVGQSCNSALGTKAARSAQAPAQRGYVGLQREDQL